MNRREIFLTTREQIREHDSALDTMMALARATLAVSAVVLGIMIISLGNLVVVMHETYLNQQGLAGLSGQSMAALLVCVVTGLGLIMASTALSVRAVGVIHIRQPISSADFGKGGKADPAVIKNMVMVPDDRAYDDLIASCVEALRDREVAVAKVGARTAMAQKFLLAGLLFAGAGVMVALPALAATSLPPW